MVQFIKKFLQNYSFAFKLWLISIVSFVVYFGAGTNLFTTQIQNTGFGNSPLFLILLFLSFVLGSIFFIIGCFSLTFKYVKNKKLKHKLLSPLLFVGILLILPIYIVFSWLIIFFIFLMHKKIKPLSFRNINYRNIIFSLFIFFILLPTWLIGYLIVGVLSNQLVLNELGYARQVETIALTGSMYPTFPKSDKKDPKEQAKETFAAADFISFPSGINLFGNRYFGRDLKRGDIIVFENKKTDELSNQIYGNPSGFVKRLIALPGDTLELKEGIVYLNNNPLKEQYTYKPRSTFAEGFLSECKVIEVPKNSIFAMGDNRKGSGDSREIGFVNFKDISLVLPIEDQKGVLDKSWRNTDKDFNESSKLKIDKIKYLELLNKKRKEAGVRLLKYQPKLEKSAELRGKVMLQNDDFSWEATKSGYTMSKAMAEANYSNTTFGEIPTQGYFEAEELIENQFQFPESEKFLLDKDFQEIGISEKEGSLNGCPTQVVVLHIAGYIPPNYSKEVISSWEESLQNLKDIQGGWLDLKNYDPVYSKNKSDIDRLNDIISQRINMIGGIVQKMEANQWLSAEQDNYIEKIDEALYDEQVKISNFLNEHN